MGLGKKIDLLRCWQALQLRYTVIFGLLPKGDSSKILVLAFSQFVLTLIDLFGVVLFSIAVALVTGGGKLPEEGRASQLLEILSLSDHSQLRQVSIVGLLALTALVFKSSASLYLSRRIYLFFALRAALVSSILMKEVIAKSVSGFERRSVQSIIFATSDGVQNLFIKGMAGLTILSSEVILIFIYIISLSVIDLRVACFLLFYFGLIVLLILKKNLSPAQILARQATKLGIQSSEITQFLGANYRVLYVSRKLDTTLNDFSVIRGRFMRTLAKRIAQSATTRYIIEVSLIVAILITSSFILFTNDSERAFLIIAFFVGASFRLVPSILRSQQEYLALRASMAASAPTIDLMKEFISNRDSSMRGKTLVSTVREDSFVPEIEVSNVCFGYRVDKVFELKKLSFYISPGTLVAIVGPSGSGKSTLLDLLLGIKVPEQGKILISRMKPEEALDAWPGLISFVPQESEIFSGSIRDNLLLETGADRKKDETLVEALRCAGFEEVLQWPKGLDTLIGSDGIRLSGGQKQRIAIARSLVSNPKLLLMDEPTSSLDSLTEEKIFADLDSIKSGRTVVVIAHRLSTVKKADQVIYLDDGELRSVGSFEQTKKMIPEFEKQAQISGLV